MTQIFTVYLNKRIILFLSFFLRVTYLAIGQTALPGSGNCLNLDGINDYLVAGKSNRGITNKITIEAWVKTSSVQLNWVAGKYSNSLGEDAGYEFFVTNGYAALYGRDGSGIYRTSGLSTTLVADNQWHHIAGIVNNNIWEVWVDGNLENRFDSNYTNVNLTTNEANFCIGTYQGFEDAYFKGNIDEVRVWNTVRTEEQIRDNMCVKLSGTERNLVGYFKFDELPTNAAFKDYSNSKLNAQLVNTSAGDVQEISGAPLGNAAKNFYKTAWNGNWTSDFAELAGNNFLPFQLMNVSGNVKGVHVYRVENSPNTLNGLTETTNLKYYYGVYTVSSDDQLVTYDVNQKVDVENNCNALHKRASNAALNWYLLPTSYTPANNTLTKTNESYRGEYMLSSVDPSPVTITGETAICAQSFLTLQANAKNAFKYLWSTGEVTSTIRIDKPGPYSVKAFASDQCFSEDSITVTAITVPEVSIAGDSVICPDSTVVLQVKAAHLFKYLWNTGETTSSIRVSKPGTYSVKAFAAEQCFTEASVEVSAPAFEECKPPVQHVLIPNIITPNGDNRNETFYIKNMELNRWQLKIFNRWGKLVYSSNGYLNDWNARDVADGIYYYVLNAPDHSINYKGYLEVIK